MQLFRCLWKPGRAAHSTNKKKRKGEKHVLIGQRGLERGKHQHQPSS
jgi:hypothetical protein